MEQAGVVTMLMGALAVLQDAMLKANVWRAAEELLVMMLYSAKTLHQAVIAKTSACRVEEEGLAVLTALAQTAQQNARLILNVCSEARAWLVTATFSAH